MGKDPHPANLVSSAASGGLDIRTVMTVNMTVLNASFCEFLCVKCHFTPPDIWDKIHHQAAVAGCV